MMKKLLYTLAAVSLSQLAIGQTPNTNNVKTTTYQVKTQNGTINTTTSQNLTDDEKIESITYFDGLGRSVQSIAKQAGGNKQDIITPVVYDELGRQTRDYLPIARGTSSLNFETSLLPNIDGDIIAINTFYNNKYPSDFVGMSINSVNPFSEKVFEASPLNRVLEQGAPGKDWLANPLSDTDHTIKFGYQTNGSNEVRFFKVSHPNNDTEETALEYEGFYAVNELYKTITKDENWQFNPDPQLNKHHTTEEFKDKQGRVILKRTYNNSESHDTYYVYDDYGNLTYVLSPEGSSSVLDGSNNVLQPVLDKLCYQYHYDYRNRLIEKKIPGKGWEYIVYNKLDQPILTQDANLGAQNLWLFTKYDVFGRVAYTGMMSSNSPRATLQTAVNGLDHTNTTRVISPNTIAGTVIYYDKEGYPTANIQQLLTINYYDDYNWDTGNSFEASYSMNLSSGLAPSNGNQIEKTSAIGWGNAGFTSQATISGDGYVQWTITQTDKAVMVGLSKTNSAPDHHFNTIDYALYTGADTMSRVYIYEEGVGKSIPVTYYGVGDVFKVERVGDQILYKKNDVVFYSSMTSSTGELLADSAFNHTGTIIEDVFIGYSVMGQAFSDNTKSLATGSKIRVLDTNDWITNVSYYDDKGRPIHSTSVNPYLNTTDATSSLLDFTGKVLKTHATHKLAKKLSIPIVTVDKFIYDHAGRLLRQVQSVNSGAEQLIAKNNYDGLGQLIQKQVGGTLPQWSTYVNYAPNVSTTNYIITKTGGTNVWTDAGIATQESIQGDGYLSFKVTQVWNSYMAGLSYTDTNNNYTSINYAIYIITGGKVNVYENGVNKGEKTSYIPGDLFSVERRGTSIYYLKNGEAFYASLTPTTTASMVGDVSIFHTGTVIKDLVLVNLESTLQDVDYAYNIRGWLKNINNPSSLGNDLFGFQIGYNSPTVFGATALYNGNISETLWKTNNVDNSLKSYKYTYDALNRITVGQDNTVDGRYSVSGIGYDKNGNITNLLRNGHTAVDSHGMVTAYDIMDDLDYDYDGNQLKKVTDASSVSHGFSDGADLTVEYDYDANGNIVEDHNKGIELIEYNHLNLPTEVTFLNTSGGITYVYDATGVKLKKLVSEGNNLKSTSYAGNYIYEASWSTFQNPIQPVPSLKFFNHPEGYVEPSGLGSFDYIYQYKDHLGNIRLSYKETASTSVNESFSGTTYDWTTPGSGSINSNNDKMNINITNKWNATLKYMDIIPGETLKISFDFDKGTMNLPYFFVLERINGVWEAQGNRDAFAVQTGHFEVELTLTGDYVQLYFEKGGAVDDGVLTTCSVDNFSVSQTELEIIEENNYYPFGLKHKGYNNVINGTDHKYGFGGKEEQDELGLGWIDITARNYDPALGRWMNLDPLAEQMRRHSPYNYAFNNPIFFIDPDGMAPQDVILNGTQAEKDAYLQMLSASTGNNYSLDSNNKLVNDGANANFTGNKSAELASVIDKGIASSEDYTLNLTGGTGDDKTVFIDSYTTGKVDISDLKLLGGASTALQGAAIGHYLNEIQEVSGYSTASESKREGDFSSAHEPSLSTEGKIYGELVGDNTITKRTSYATGGAVNGYQTSIYEFNANNKFELQQGATSVSKPTTVNIGGVNIPSTEITTVPTGELKTVKKKI